MSKLLTLNAAGDAAAVTDATIGDIFSTAISTTQAVTGMYGLVQKLGIAALGATVQTMRLRGDMKFWVA